MLLLKRHKALSKTLRGFGVVVMRLLRGVNGLDETLIGRCLRIGKLF